MESKYMKKVLQMWPVTILFVLSLTLTLTSLVRISNNQDLRVPETHYIIKTVNQDNCDEKEVTRRLDIVKIYTDVVREAYSSNLPKSDTELIDKEYSLAMTNYGKCTVLSQDIIK